LTPAPSIALRAAASSVSGSPAMIVYIGMALAP
jgi:hypothetical protein